MCNALACVCACVRACVCLHSCLSLSLPAQQGVCVRACACTAAYPSPLIISLRSLGKAPGRPPASRVRRPAAQGPRRRYHLRRRRRRRGRGGRRLRAAGGRCRPRRRILPPPLGIPLVAPLGTPLGAALGAAPRRGAPEAVRWGGCVASQHAAKEGHSGERRVQRRAARRSRERPPLHGAMRGAAAAGPSPPRGRARASFVARRATLCCLARQATLRCLPRAGTCPRRRRGHVLRCVDAAGEGRRCTVGGSGGVGGDKARAGQPDSGPRCLDTPTLALVRREPVRAVLVRMPWVRLFVVRRSIRLAPSRNRRWESILYVVDKIGGMRKKRAVQH
jgi:hypothetical protein